MHSSTYRGLPDDAKLRGSYRRYGLTDPARIDAYVNRRLNDPSLLAPAAGPAYADFFKSHGAVLG